jgi:flagellar biosynthesis anti-sigma factor FlgM
MRIDSYRPSSSAVEVSNSPGMSKADVQGSVTPAAAEDRTTLTSDSAAVETLVSTAMNSPAVRQETVENLRQAVSGGQYQLDPAAIADAMLADQ